MKSSLCVHAAEESFAVIQSKLAGISFEEEDEVTKDKIESWLVLKLLERLTVAELLQYPLTLEGVDSLGLGYERPDFRATSRATRIGIEVTQARHRDHAWALDRSSSIDGACVESSHFRPNHEIDRKTGMKPNVVRPGEKLTGRGWNVSEAEREWCDYMLRAIQEKHTKLTEKGYHRFDEDWLLISDCTPISSLISGHLGTACTLLHDRLIANYYRLEGGFHQIYVRCQSDIVALNKHGFRVLRR